MSTRTEKPSAKPPRQVIAGDPKLRPSLDLTPDLTIPAGEIDLGQTLESGQCFRWRRLAAHEYWGVVNTCALWVRQEADQLRVRHCGGTVPDDLAGFIQRYFDLPRDYRAILRRLRRDRQLARVAPRRAGIHILRQEPFEVVISFIISSNNHIPRIRSVIERLCRRYGTPVDTLFGRTCSFPSPDKLASARLSTLRLKCGLGYRDTFVRSAARAIVAQGDFPTWNELPTDALRQRLLRLDGVGEKVADCILLFGFHRLEAFPVDTWVRRAMTDLYFPGQAPRLRQIQVLAARRFGAHAGIAQQYLFAGKRSNVNSEQWTVNSGPG